MKVPGLLLLRGQQDLCFFNGRSRPNALDWSRVRGKLELKQPPEGPSMNQHNQAELTRALFEESGDALFLFDPGPDELVDVNPMGQRLTGFSREELLGLP